MKIKILIIALMLMGTSAFGQLADPHWEGHPKEVPVYDFKTWRGMYPSTPPNFSRYNKLKLQGLGGVFVPENLGKMTLVPKTVARKEED